MYFIFKSKKKKKSFSCHLAAVGNNMAPPAIVLNGV